MTVRLLFLLRLLLLLQVTGSFGNQLSLLLSGDDQVHSQAVQQHCCYTVESQPSVQPRPAAAKPSQQPRLGTEQGSVSMMVDKLLKTYPGLNGTGIKVGEYLFARGAGGQRAKFMLQCLGGSLVEQQGTATVTVLGDGGQQGHFVVKEGPG
jgi:hypothetical protein